MYEREVALCMSEMCHCISLIRSAASLAHLSVTLRGVTLRYVTETCLTLRGDVSHRDVRH